MNDPNSWTGALALMAGLSVLMLGAGLLVVGIAKRASDGRLGLNGWAGIRTKATMSSADAWHAAHVAGERSTTKGGWVMAASGIAAATAAVAVERSDPDRAVVVLAIVLGTLTAVSIGFVLHGAWRGNAAARAVTTQGSLQ